VALASEISQAGASRNTARVREAALASWRAWYAARYRQSRPWIARVMSFRSCSASRKPASGKLVALCTFGLAASFGCRGFSLHDRRKGEQR